MGLTHCVDRQCEVVCFERRLTDSVRGITSRPLTASACALRLRHPRRLIASPTAPFLEHVPIGHRGLLHHLHGHLQRVGPVVVGGVGEAAQLID